MAGIKSIIGQNVVKEYFLSSLYCDKTKSPNIFVYHSTNSSGEDIDMVHGRMKMVVRGVE
jgi:hypothetical protein